MRSGTHSTCNHLPGTKFRIAFLLYMLMMMMMKPSFKCHIGHNIFMLRYYDCFMNEVFWGILGTFSVEQSHLSLAVFAGGCSVKT